LFAFSAILFFVISILCYITYFIPVYRKTDTNGISNANRRINTADIYFFNASWCPHCTSVKPAWNAFVNTYDETVVHEYTINCVGKKDGIDCSVEDAKTVELLHCSRYFFIEKFKSIYKMYTPMFHGRNIFI
jgi:thiol-disulfide isomerase/thioredoxin